MRQGDQGWCTGMTLRDGIGGGGGRGVSGWGTHVHKKLKKKRKRKKVCESRLQNQTFIKCDNDC